MPSFVTGESIGGGVLVFAVEGVRYGIPADRVEEVLRAVAPVPLPRAPAAVEGVIDVRGRLVPVLDLRRPFRHPPRSVRPSDHLILARAGTRTVALRVDRALELAALDSGAVEDPRTAVPGEGLVAGVARLPDGLVLIHDPEAFLTGAEERTLDAALADAAGSGEERER